MSSGWGAPDQPGQAGGGWGGQWQEPVPATKQAAAPLPPAGAGWGQDEQERSGWDAPAPRPSSNGLWADDYETVVFRPSRAPSPVMLYAAVASAVLGLGLGLGLGRSYGLVALLGWLLAGILTVVLVAAYQSKDLKAATSMWYVPNRAATGLRLAALALGTIGVVVNSYYFAHWLASR